MGSCVSTAPDVALPVVKSEGADNDPTDTVGLVVAAKAGKTAVVRRFLRQGAPVNGRDGEFTALQAAASNGHKEVCELLLSYGADVDAISSHNLDALQAAIVNGHNPTARLLIERGAASVDDLDARDRLLISAASVLDNLEMVRLLLLRSSDVEGRPRIGPRTHEAMLKAVWWGDRAVETVRLLLESGVDADAQGAYGQMEGWFALAFAAQSNHLELVRLLIERGANLQASDKIGFTSLMYAARDGHLEIARLLLDAGARCSAVDHRGFTALDIAMRNERHEVASLLQSRGAVRTVRAYEADGADLPVVTAQSAVVLP